MLEQDDYLAFLAELDITQEFLDALMELPTLYDTTWNTDIKLLPSPIHGIGLFAGLGVASGDFIAVARVKGNRYTAGRFTNHSPTPNAKFVRTPQGDLFLEALEDVPKDTEFTIDYRQAAEVNGYLSL